MYYYMEKAQMGWLLTFFFSLSSDKNMVSESSYEVQTSDSRCQGGSSFLRLIFALSLLPRYCYIQLFSWDGHQCLFYRCCFSSPSYAKPCLAVTCCSSSIPSACFTITIASQPRIILLFFCNSSKNSNWWPSKTEAPAISSFLLKMTFTCNLNKNCQISLKRNYLIYFAIWNRLMIQFYFLIKFWGLC